MAVSTYNKEVMERRFRPGVSVRGPLLVTPWVQHQGGDGESTGAVSGVYEVAGAPSWGGQAGVFPVKDSSGLLLAMRVGLLQAGEARRRDRLTEYYAMLHRDPSRFPATVIPREVFTEKAEFPEGQQSLVCEVLPWMPTTLRSFLKLTPDHPGEPQPLSADDAVDLFLRIGEDVLQLESASSDGGYFHCDIDEGNIALRDQRLDRAQLVDPGLLTAIDTPQQQKV